MPSVAVRILHPLPDAAAGDLVRWVAEARAELAERHRRGFEVAGADDVAVVQGSVDDTTFGARLRGILDSTDASGLVVLGSGSIPLATVADRRSFVAAAASPTPLALANNRYSADAIAIARVAGLPRLPDLPGDNAMPRWLAEVAGIPVEDLRRRWRLAVDIDGPLDLVLVGASTPSAPVDLSLVRARIAAIQGVARDARAEVLVAGRTSAATVAWLERHTASRTRALIEERGLRAATRLATRETRTGIKPKQRPPRPPTSVLGTILDRDGPESIGDHLTRLSDAAIVDTRVLLAHRLGADEAAWPDCGGPVRVGSPAGRSDRGSLAPGADDVRGDRADPGRARRAHPRRTGHPRSSWAAHGPEPRPPTRPATGPRRPSGQDEALAARIRDEIRAGRPHDLRAVHGPRPVRPGRWLLPIRGGPARSSRRLPDGTRDAPDLRDDVARFVDDVWQGLDRPDPFVIREHGAGDGALAIAILTGLRASRSRAGRA